MFTPIAEELRQKSIEDRYEHRRFLDETRIRLSDSLDKYLLTLSTGALYLSILFTGSLNGTLKYKYILLIGWPCLLVSTLTVIASLWLSIKAHTKQRSITETEIEFLLKRELPSPSDNPWNNYISCLRWFALLFFCIGLVSLASFYFLNLS